MSKSKDCPVNGKLSDQECDECGDFIPAKRVEIIDTEHCVGCAEDLEDSGRGTPRHKMNFNVKTRGDEVEEVETTIVRKSPPKR